MPKEKVFIREVKNKHGKKTFINVNGQTKFVITENKTHIIPNYKKTKQ